MNRKENEMERDGMTGPMDYFEEPAPGQFHPLAADSDLWDAFVLVLAVNPGSMYTECTVVPGSMDMFQAGPDDLLVRNPDRSGFWMLDFSQVRTMRADALLPGFAALTPRMLDYVRTGLELYRQDKESAEYRYGVPFIGKTDSRRSYHKDLDALMQTANKEAEELFWGRLAASFRWTPGKFDPGGLKAGLIEASSRIADIGIVACFSRSFIGKPGLYNKMFELFTPMKEKAGRNAGAKAMERSEMAEDRTSADKPGTELAFYPEDMPGFLSVKLDLERETISVEVLPADSGATNKRAFEGIQLRRSPDGHLIGTIRGGAMEARLDPDIPGDGIYFSRPGDIPLKGKWEVK